MRRRQDNSQRSLAGSLVALSLLALAGCETPGRSEASQVMRALEVVRAAPPGQKRGPVDALAGTPCATEAVCTARDRCAAAYRHLAQGVEMEERVKAEIDRLEHAPPANTAALPGLAVDLDHAEDELKGARAELPACEEAASQVRRTFGI